MPIRKLRQLDSECAGITLPKEDLRENGLLNEEGVIDDEQYALIEQIDEGEWKIKAVSEL